jgi:hypothetical protein
MLTVTKKKRKEEAHPWKAGTSSGHTTNLEQSILRLSISMLVTNNKLETIRTKVNKINLNSVDDS